MVFGSLMVKINKSLLSWEFLATIPKKIKSKIGTNRVTNTTAGTLATSGYADGAVAKSGTAREFHDEDKVSLNRISGAANENADAVHQTTAADTKRSASAKKNCADESRSCGVGSVSNQRIQTR